REHAFRVDCLDWVRPLEPERRYPLPRPSRALYDYREEPLALREREIQIRRVPHSAKGSYEKPSRGEAEGGEEAQGLLAGLWPVEDEAPPPLRRLQNSRLAEGEIFVGRLGRRSIRRGGAE